MLPGQTTVLNNLNSVVPRFLPDYDLSDNPETKGYKSYYGYFIRNKDSFKLKRIRAESVTPKSFDPNEIKFMFIISVTKPSKNKNKENSLHSTVPIAAVNVSTTFTQTTQLKPELGSIQNKRSTLLNATKKTGESLLITSQCSQQISTTPNSQTTSIKYDMAPPSKMMSSLIPVKPGPNKDKMSYIQVGESLLRVRQCEGPLLYKPQVNNYNQRSEIQSQFGQGQVREEMSTDNDDTQTQSSVILDEISITDQLIKELDIEILEPSLELDEEEENPPNQNNLTIEDDNSFNYDIEEDDYTEPVITVDLDKLTDLDDLNQDIITEEIDDSDEEEMTELQSPPRLKQFIPFNRSVLSSNRNKTKLMRQSISPLKQARSGFQMHRHGIMKLNPIFQKRQQMNNAERARRQELAQQFDDLFNKIPRFFKKKYSLEEKKSMSKITCLNLAKKYSLYLRHEEGKLATERNNLEKRNHNLRVALQQRLDILQAHQQGDILQAQQHGISLD